MNLLYSAIFLDMSGHYLSTVPVNSSNNCMSRPVAQIKDHLWASRLPTETNFEPISLFEKNGLDGGDKANFSFQGLLRAIKVDNTAGLLARIDYYFPGEMQASGQAAFRYAEVLNHLLMHSKVFVVKDIDGDLGYYLRLDAVLQGQYERSNLASFLDNVSQDMEVLLKYFGCIPPTSESGPSITATHCSSD